MRTKRLRVKIKDFLRANPESNSRQIYEHINAAITHGTTMNQLSNILSKDPDIVKVGQERVSGFLGGGYVCCIWKLQED